MLSLTKRVKNVENNNLINKIKYEFGSFSVIPRICLDNIYPAFCDVGSCDGNRKCAQFEKEKE